MRLWSSVRTAMREHPFLVDAGLAAVLLVLALFLHDPDIEPVNSPLAPVPVIAAILACAPLAWRRVAPRPVLALSVAGACLVTLLVQGQTAVSVASVLALYTLAVSSDRRITWIAWGATLVPLTVAAMATGIVSQSWQVFGYVPWVTAGAALGDGLRNRRAYVAAVEERAAHAERTREEVARLRVAQERLRIARDLHDVVAHRIAVVSVQAGVAGHLLTSQPERAREALEHVRQAGAEILEELSEVLDVLRQPDEPDVDTRPVPGLGQLDALVASFATAGLAVETTLTGKPRVVGAKVDLVTYRVLQEALTNAHKHGTGTAHLTLAYTPSALDVQVTNPVERSGSSRGGEPGAGYGLVGMRERILAVGGVLEAAPGPPGQFHVDVRLPLPATATA